MNPTAKEPAKKMQNRIASVYCQSGFSEPEQVFPSHQNLQTSSSSLDESKVSQAIETVCESSTSPTGDSTCEYSPNESLSKDDSPKGDIAKGDFRKEKSPEKHAANIHQNPNIITPPEDLSSFGYKSPPSRSYDFKLVVAENARPASPSETSLEPSNTGSQSISPSTTEANRQEYPFLISESTIWEKILSSRDAKPLFARPIETSEQGKRKHLVSESQPREEGDSRKRLRPIPSTSILPPWSSDLSDMTDETDALGSDTETDISNSDNTNPSSNRDSPEGNRFCTESVIANQKASSRQALTPCRTLTESETHSFEKTDNFASIILTDIPSRPDLDDTITEENQNSLSSNTPDETYSPQLSEPEDLAYSSQPSAQEELAYSPQPLLQEELASSPQPSEQEEIASSPQPLEPEELAHVPQPLEQEEIAHVPQPLEQEELAHVPHSLEQDELPSSPQPLEQEEFAHVPSPLEQDELALVPQPLEQEELTFPPYPLEQEQLAFSPYPWEQNELAFFPHPLEQEELAHVPHPLEQEELAYPASSGTVSQFNHFYNPFFQDNHGEGFAEAAYELVPNAYANAYANVDANVDAVNHHQNLIIQPPQIINQITHSSSILPVLKTQRYQTNENIQQHDTGFADDIHSSEETEPEKGIDYSRFRFPMTTVSLPYNQNIARVPGYDPDTHKDIRIKLFAKQSVCQITRRRFVRHDVSVLQGHDPRFKYETNKRFKESNPYEYEFVRTNFFPGTQELDTKTRAASCAYCEDLHFYKLKNSCYLFHMAYIHGISFRNYLYPDGVEAGIYTVPKAKISGDISKPTTEDRSCVLCPKCFEVFPTHTSKATESRAPLAKYHRHFKTVHQKTGGHSEFYDECVWYPYGSY